MSTSFASGADVNVAIQAPANGEISRDVEWLFIVVKKKQPVLHVLHLKSSQTGATIMHILNKEFKSTKPTGDWYQRVTLEDAIVSRLSVGDPEAQDYPRKVIIENSTPRPDLTEAFLNPTSLRGTEFLRLHEQFKVVPSTSSGDRPCHAILFKMEAQVHLVAAVLLVVIMISIAVGSVVGYFSHNMGWGLAASSAAIGIFAMIQAYLFGMKLLG